MLRELKIKALMLDKNHNTPVVILGMEKSPMVLPIWIGSCEAMALSLALENTDFPRPLTHDLLINTIEALDAQVVKVVIDSLKENTYYAKLMLKDLTYPEMEDDPNSIIEIDCRPSDAIVIAAKKHVPIFTTDEVIVEGGVKVEESSSKDEKEKFKNFVEHLKIDDFKNYFQNDQSNQEQGEKGEDNQDD
ncbi:bifunctional nuclease family protein [Mesoaciditoga lauensis]|uniref:bifunctional nuclease family protein n=1 Tax=Mesoaciditoga lauensis TaxID=1495039 RepID=UPI000B021144|nr:bifunctional nuclease family protein [Mesoaciditoga lauensis]